MATQENRIPQLSENMRKLKKGFWFEYSVSLRFAALNYVTNDKELDVDRLKSTRKTLQKKTGVFSQFRGLMLFSIASLMDAGFPDPGEAIDRLIQSADYLKKAGYRSSPYNPLCAYSLLKNAMVPDDFTRIPERGMEIYKLMRKSHPLLTGREDYVLSLLMATLPDMTPEQIGTRMENSYSALHDEGFMKGNQLQFMSHILSLDRGDSQIQATRCAEVRKYLRERKIRVPATGSGSLAFITLMSLHSMEVVDRVVSLVGELKRTKGFRFTGIIEQLLVASSLAAHEFSDNANLETITGLTIQTIMQAQQTAIIASIVAANAAAASAAAS